MDSLKQLAHGSPGLAENACRRFMQHLLSSHSTRGFLSTLQLDDPLEWMVIEKDKMKPMSIPPRLPPGQVSQSLLKRWSQR